MRLVALLLVTSLGGCDHLLPLGAASDRGQPDRPLDGALDLPPAEGAPRPERRADARPPVADRGFPPPEGTSPLCPETTKIQMAASCGQQNPACTAVDPDCDGLVGARDPWPTVCNRLVMLEPFAAAGAPGWRLTSYASASGTGAACGKTDTLKNTYCSAVGGLASFCSSGACLDPTQCLCGGAGPGWVCNTGSGRVPLAASGPFLSPVAMPAGLTDASYVVEVRFRLGAIVNPSSWSVGVRAAEDFSLGQFRACTLWVSTANAQPSPGLHLVAHINAGTGNGVWTGGSNYAGQEYTLQTWAEGSTQVCRLLSADGSQEVAKREIAGLAMTKPGGLLILSSGRAAEIEHVMIFLHQ